MTLDECKDMARRVALSLPPSDFGSTRAINAFGETLCSEITKERAACLRKAAAEIAAKDATIAKLCEEIDELERRCGVRI